MNGSKDYLGINQSTHVEKNLSDETILSAVQHKGIGETSKLMGRQKTLPDSPIRHTADYVCNIEYNAMRNSNIQFNLIPVIST